MAYDRDDLEKAFNKELFIIKNDLYYQQLELERHSKKELLRIDISYKPQSSLSGDTYSLRKTKDGRLVGFVADAMGKGISAALTSMGTTRFLNYFFDELEDEGKFSLDAWIKKFVKFIKTNLMDDELLSISFLELDLRNSRVYYALCGMPSLLALNKEGALIVIKSNNPPMMSFTDMVHIDMMPTGSLAKLLCYSDGLSESFTQEEKPYALKMREDFVASLGVEDFHGKVHRAIGNGDDDLTYVYVQKLNFHDEFETLQVESGYEAIENALHVIALYLKPYEMSSKCSSEIMLTFSELLLNALEHGSFGVNRERKNYLIEHNLFDEEMMQLESQNKYKIIEIHYGVVQSGEGKMFEATITDSGKGFDTKMLKNIVINAHNFNGRGFIIIKKLLDHFYFNEKGNAITIQKILKL